jgi:hypothetical protein
MPTYGIMQGSGHVLSDFRASTPQGVARKYNLRWVPRGGATLREMVKGSGYRVVRVD